jgi:uncharacterized RDD family membrane protein YckC
MAVFGSRAAAQLLDLLVQVLTLQAISLALLGIQYLVKGTTITSVVFDLTFAIYIIGMFLVFFGYFTYFEGTRNGQTPGKRWAGLRVVRDEGAPIDFRAAAIRNLIRILEMALGAYFFSLVFILFSPKYKRIGDYAAGTIVIKERTPGTNLPKAKPMEYRTPERARTPETMVAQNSSGLTREQIEIIRRFCERRGELKPDVQADLAKQIAEPLMLQLGIQTPVGQFNYSDFLEALYTKALEERGAL